MLENHLGQYLVISQTSNQAYIAPKKVKYIRCDHSDTRASSRELSSLSLLLLLHLLHLVLRELGRLEE